MRRSGTLTAAALLAVCLAACGSVAGGSGGSGGTSGGSTGGAAPSTTASSSRIEAVTGGAIAGAGHGSDTGAVGKGSSCFATFQPLENKTGIDLGASIKGTLWVKCAVPAAEHSLTLELQQKHSSGWTTVATKNSNQLPPPMFIPVLVTAPCVPGDWRLHWSVTGNVGGQYFAGGATGEVRHVEASDCA